MGEQIVTFRAGEETVNLLRQLEKESGLTKSDILRRLIELAASRGSELDLIEPWINGTDKTTLRELAARMKEVATSIEAAS